MPTIPDPLTWTNVSADVINAIRNSGSINYRDYIPVATPNADSIRTIGSIIMDAPNLRNAFATDLINMIVKVIITSKSYESPLARLKKGKLDMGETVEEIFTNIARAELYMPSTADQTVFKRRIPDIRAAFHVVNSQIKYPTSISNEQLSAAFNTQEGLYKLIEDIYQQLYTADAYDEFNLAKYLLASHIIHGRIHTVPIADYTASVDNVRAAVTTMKATSNDMQFMTGKFNIAGVKTHAQHAEQVMIVSSHFDASMAVNVQATSFNEQYVKLLNDRIVIDSFGSIDVPRLAECAPELCTNIVTATDETGRVYVVSADLIDITADQLATLDTIPAVIIDREFIQIYDRLYTMEDIRNPDGLYTNAFLHVWRIYSTSPFAPAAAFDPTQNGTVTAITLTASTDTAVPGTSVQISAAVTATGIVDQSVTYTVSGNTDENTTIDAAGNLHIGADESASSITVFAASVSTPAVVGSVTIGIVGIAFSISYDILEPLSGPESANAGEMIELLYDPAFEGASLDNYIISLGEIPYNARITSVANRLVIDFIMPAENITVSVDTSK